MAPEFERYPKDSRLIKEYLQTNAPSMRSYERNSWSSISEDNTFFALLPLAALFLRCWWFKCCHDSL